MKNNKLTQNDLMKMNNNRKKKKRVLRKWVKVTLSILLILILFLLWVNIMDYILVLKGY